MIKKILALLRRRHQRGGALAPTRQSQEARSKISWDCHALKWSLAMTMAIAVFGVVTMNSAYASSDKSFKYEEAVFAMGCFWCGESEFRGHDDPTKVIDGIISVRVGFAGGTEPNPTYEHHPGYKESVKIIYDPKTISYSKLLNIFWHNIDPFDAKGQFCDKGFPYTAVIFYKNDEQKSQALVKREEIQKMLGGRDIVTEIIPYTNFYDAEEYHQNYKAKNPIRYKYYRWNCGRDQRLKEVWKE